MLLTPTLLMEPLWTVTPLVNSTTIHSISWSVPPVMFLSKVIWVEEFIYPNTPNLPQELDVPLSPLLEIKRNALVVSIDVIEAVVEVPVDKIVAVPDCILLKATDIRISDIP